MRFDDEVVLLATPIIGTPLYDAGVDRDDLITAIGGVEVSGRVALERVLANRAPGDPVEIRYESRGETFSVTVPLASDPELAGHWLPDDTVSAEQAAFRAAWKTPAMDPSAANSGR